MERAHAVIVAAGDSLRAGRVSGVKKQFVPIGGRPVVVHALVPFAASPLIDTMVCVLAREDLALFEEQRKAYPLLTRVEVVEGGATRQDSVAAGLVFLEKRGLQDDWVVVHDGVRPFVTTALIEQVIQAAAQYGGAAAGLPVTDALKVVAPDGRIQQSAPRETLWAMQTPQVFRLQRLSEALRKAAADNFIGADEAALMTRMGDPVLCVEGLHENRKMTTPSDLQWAKQAWKGERRMPRIGIGYDLHRLEKGYRCQVGGVTLDSEKGTVGYSDGDPLLHAICDALLGAAGLGDIGLYFPTGDPRWKGVESLILLQEVSQMLLARSCRVIHLDTVVAAQMPRLAPYVPEMKMNISRPLLISPHQVNIKATTGEEIGFVGRGEGIAAYAVCTLDLLADASVDS